MSKQIPPPLVLAQASPEEQLLRRGIAAFRAGKGPEAERMMRKVLKRNPRSPDALHILAILAARADRNDEAERLLHRCIAAAPTYADPHDNLGNILMRRRQFAEAQAAYTKALQLAPRYPLPYYNLGHCLHVQGKLAEAESFYRKALALAPDYFAAKVNLGNVLREREFYPEAALLYREVLEHQPNQHEVRLNLGNVYRLCGEISEASDQYETLLRALPDNGRARLALGLLALKEQDLEKARSLIDEVQRHRNAPAPEILAARALLEERLGNLETALASVGQAIDLGAASPQNYLLLAKFLARVNRRRDAVVALERSITLFGERPPSLLGNLISNQRHLCDWRDWNGRVSALVEQVRGGAAGSIDPFFALSVPGLSPADLLQVARAIGLKFRPWMERGPKERTHRELRRDERLRLGYLSADFREHPCAWLSASVFELHERRGFETFAYAIGPADDSPMRQRLRLAFDHFVELTDASHIDAAERIAADGIDILVDMQGYTLYARPEILAQQPAPIQVSWLGFPGTMGVSFVDYLIVDPSVVRSGESDFYTESLAFLPHCYLPFDPRRIVAPARTRAAEGLPEDAFVFCSFNNPYKITPEVFDLWCTLLRDLPNAILWLYAGAEARANLSSAAAARGLSPERIHFAEKRPQAEHLGRLALADLFLDTWPYNGHTTALDALSVGTPVLTCPGSTFPSRVAASQLTTMGLHELIAEDPGDFLDRACRLAREPARLAALRAQLQSARQKSPLFDAEVFTRAMETLYRDMWARHSAGLPPMELSAVG